MILFILLISAIFNLGLWYGANRGKIPFALGLETEKEFYGRLNDYNAYTIFDYANKNLPADSKILLFREFRGYLSNVDYVIGDPLTQKVVDYSKITNEGEMLNELKKAGITHILINTKIGFAGIHQEMEVRYSKELISLMDKTLEKYGILLVQDNGAYLYQIK